MKRKNSRKENFFKTFPNDLIEDVEKEFKDHLSFSFKYFDNSQTCGQDFQGWSHEQLYKLLNKLKEYCKDTQLHWQMMKVGKGSSHILEIYGSFPKKSDFIHPTYIPLDVEWARFRLESDMRLIGFIVKRDICSKLAIHPNIFYIVFLDKDHRFCKNEST